MKKIKQENLISENDSMLVSDVKWNSQQTPCNCDKRLAIIEERIQSFCLKIDEMSSNLNLAFTKQMETYSKLVEEQKKVQNIQYVVWELKQVSESQNEKISNDMKKKNMEIINLNEEFRSWSRMLRQIKNWKASQFSINSQMQKEVHENFKKNREQTDNKLKKMFQAVEEIGLLQRKMLKENREVVRIERPPSRAKQVKERKSLPGKNTSICNQSTMIANSRHLYM